MSITKEEKGAWIIHHGKKVSQAINGSADFPVLDETAKASSLLARLGEGWQTVISKDEVTAVARSIGINPRAELSGILSTLKDRDLIDMNDHGVELLGLTTRGALQHAADYFDASDPSKFEQASIQLSDIASVRPTTRKDALERISDEFSLTRIDSRDFLQISENIGFVDSEGDGDSGLVFNGNLFRRDNAAKTHAVLSSLSQSETTKVNDAVNLVSSKGCSTVQEIKNILGDTLFQKLMASAVFDQSVVINEAGSHGFITNPSAFHKFVDPMVDDAFDLAKSLVAALSYGMHQRDSSQGKIAMLDALMRKLIRGLEVGPATAIGADYRALEISRVVKTRPDPYRPNRFYMKLLKPEVGQLALAVLRSGSATSQSLKIMPSAPMSDFRGPESARQNVRKAQTPMSRRATLDILDAVRQSKFK